MSGKHLRCSNLASCTLLFISPQINFSLDIFNFGGHVILTNFSRRTSSLPLNLSPYACKPVVIGFCNVYQETFACCDNLTMSSVHTKQLKTIEGVEGRND